MQEANKMRDRLIKEFTENYMGKLFFFCLKKTGSNTEAEDLTQDIAFQIITALNKGTVPISFSAWVWQIARNRYSVWATEKHNRNQSVTGFDINDYELADGGKDILDEMIYAEQIALLRRELAFIKSDYRNVVVAYYIENKNVRDIALSLSLSINAIQQRLHRARTILKEGMNMAREFGKLSYNPENIVFIMNGLRGSNNEPFNYISRLLCKNIFLAAYRNPSTAEELAFEVGVALPYMEEELSNLVNATLMKKNGNKYETNFFIVSGEAQGKINAHRSGITSELASAIIDALEFKLNWKNENCPEWHEGYQPYEDMKWALLMKEVDLIANYTLRLFCRKEKDIPNIGPWGHTIRPNGGEWDVLGLENYEGDRPCFVGLRGSISSPIERNNPDIDFGQFKFAYRNIASQTPDVLRYAEAEALQQVAKGKSSEAKSNLLKNLETYGYIKKTECGYEPNILVMSHDKQKEMPKEVRMQLEELRYKARDIAMRHYVFCKEEIYKEIPEFLKNDDKQVEHACISIFGIRGAVLEEAIRKGYLYYNENDPQRMLGAYIMI